VAKFLSCVGSKVDLAKRFTVNGARIGRLTEVAGTRRAVSLDSLPSWKKSLPAHKKFPAPNCRKPAAARWNCSVN